MTIAYENEDGQVVARMTEVAGTRAAAVLVAQKYMQQMRGIVTACVLDSDVEVVVRRATAWQKLN